MICDWLQKVTTNHIPPFHFAFLHLRPMNRTRYLAQEPVSVEHLEPEALTERWHSKYRWSITEVSCCSIFCYWSPILHRCYVIQCFAAMNHVTVPLSMGALLPCIILMRCYVDIYHAIYIMLSCLVVYRYHNTQIPAIL